MKTGDKYWNDIDNLLNEEVNHKYDADLEKHDQIIHQYILDEIDRTSINEEKCSNASSSRGLMHNILYRLSQIWSDVAVINKIGYAMGLLCVLILPIYLYTESINGSNTVNIPQSVAVYSDEAVLHIEHSRGSYGLIDKQPTETYKAFMTGVLHTDIYIYELSGNEIDNTAYRFYSDMINGKDFEGDKTDSYKNALDIYSEKEEYIQWLNTGKIIELIYVMSKVAIDTFEIDVLKDTLTEYKRTTKVYKYTGQSDRYIQQHKKLIFLSSKEILDFDEIEDINEASMNMKILIR